MTKGHQFDVVVSGNSSLVLVDFYADWCEPCKWLDQILVDIEPQLMEKADILKVDIEAFPAIKERFDIRGIPVLMLFKDGKEVWRMNGFLAGNELLAKIETFI